nr:hypothetical protein [uncultured Dysosmobacter sp.]
MSDYNPQPARDPIRDFEIRDDFKERTTSRPGPSRYPRLTTARDRAEKRRADRKFTMKPGPGYYLQGIDPDDLARLLADFNEKAREAMAQLVEAIEALHTRAEMEPDEETLMTLLEAKRERQKHKTHPCPHDPPKRPAKAARAVKQFYPHSKSRPQARSHIKRRGDRRRT